METHLKFTMNFPTLAFKGESADAEVLQQILTAKAICPLLFPSESCLSPSKGNVPSSQTTS